MKRRATAPIHIDLEGTVNTRDLGGWPTHDGQVTRMGRVWRSDAFTRATPADRDALAHHGVRTVIDLRTTAERLEEPHPLEDDARFDVMHVDLFAPVLAAFMRGEVREDPFDLATHYRASFALARDAYAQVFTHITAALDSHAGPVVVHCTAGKDRTGLVTALLLRGAGVADADIARDYAITHERIAPLRPRLLADGVAKGFPAELYERMLEARPETLRAVLLEADDALTASAQAAASRLA